MLKLNAVRPFNIFSKLVIALLLVMIPIYGISLYMNQTAEENVHNELSQSVVSSVHFYLSSFEAEMQRLMRLNKELIFDDEFQKIRTISDAMDDYTRSQTILSVKNKLHLLKTSSSFVDDVKVYIPALDRGIFANSFDNHIPDDELGVLQKSLSQYGTPFTFWNNRLLLSEVYPLPIYHLETSIALGVVLSKEQIQHSLAQISQVKDSGASFINLKQNWIVTDGKSNEPILSALKEFVSEPRFKDKASGQESVTVRGVKYLFTFEYSKLLDTYLTVNVPEDQVLGPLGKYRTLFWLLSLMSTVVIIAFSYWIFRLIHQPLKRLITSFRKVEKGDLQVEIHHHHQDEFYYLYEQFNAMVRQLNLLIQEVYEERIRSQQSELKQLQSQINPHFLYNSFFILQGLVRMNDNLSAEKMMQHLGDYFQFITRTGTEMVTLEQEVSHAQSYMEIQSMRFFRQIEVDWGSVPELYKTMQVPRLFLQPIIENAYVHGLEDKAEGGRLIVQFAQNNDYLLIVVEDNGDNLHDDTLASLHNQLRSKQPVKESTAIFNVHRRLQLKYGEKYGLSVSRGILGGMRIELKLAYPKEDHDV
ncbi:HAMP domain-containing protein [Paenibacillus sp. LMG 31458]|uniref:HAMP domain-containing protein n=1 Tax=Paenibacillus phytorum TaxID=2654977 RepID=A0ABX1XRV4_9BACL|nr:sensor histidine kinase [Paenibacillus phytorum]NOU71222.1 HAMP domain-containing protein [Paenibacillus phytorum]